MDAKEMAINNIIMQEIGLEVGPRKRLFDQDTGAAIRINDMDVVAPGCYGGKRAIEFDPYNNRKMMNQLFAYFMEKQAEETGNELVTYYNIGDRIECRMRDNRLIRSRPYIRDSLKYADIIIQLNGGSTEELSAYDQLIPSTIKKPRGRNNGK